MARISLIEPIVERALIENELAREDNFVLYVEVLKSFVKVNELTFEELCLNHIALGVPSLETITRCRRKLQEKHPELVSEKAKEIRENEEELHLEYARS